MSENKQNCGSCRFFERKKKTHKTGVCTNGLITRNSRRIKKHMNDTSCEKHPVVLIESLQYEKVSE